MRFLAIFYIMILLFHDACSKNHEFRRKSSIFFGKMTAPGTQNEKCLEGNKNSQLTFLSIIAFQVPVNREKLRNSSEKCRMFKLQRKLVYSSAFLLLKFGTCFSGNSRISAEKWRPSVLEMKTVWIVTWTNPAFSPFSLNPDQNLLIHWESIHTQSRSSYIKHAYRRPLAWMLDNFLTKFFNEVGDILFTYSFFLDK